MPDGALPPRAVPLSQGTVRATRDRIALRRRAVAIWSAGVLAILAAGVAVRAAGAPGGLAGGGMLAGLAAWLLWQDRFMRTTGGIPVLTWHSVSRDAGWLPWAEATSVTPETLDRQLALLRRMGCQSMDSVEFVRRRMAGATVPPETVILHFDDGYLDNWVAAAPLLARHGMRASLFVSLDFIAPPRPVPATILDPGAVLRWDGYLSWDELRALDGGAFGGAFGIEPHGVDHGRVPVGSRVVDHVSPGNWRRLAWVQWAAMPGDKHDWYVSGAPPARGHGTPVHESAPALAAPAWSPGGGEGEAAYRARLLRDLLACRQAFLTRLGRAPNIFCWPQNRASDAGRAIAVETGYLATTAGHGTNRADEDPAILSRVHVGERVAGFRWPAADDLLLRATILGFRGNHYWYFPVLALSLLRRAVTALRVAGGGA